MRADLHLHTHYSDGTDSPAALVERAKTAGLSLIAVTDHDSLGGWPEAEAAGKRLGVKVLPAAEFTANLHGYEVHILGYFPLAPGEAVTAHLGQMQEFRRQRMVEAVARLRARGVSISMGELPVAECCESLTAAHLGRALLQKGFAPTLRGVWRRQALRDALCDFEVSPREVIDVIHTGGGLAVWAHPAERRFRRRLLELATDGLDGVEVINNSRRGLAVAGEMTTEMKKLGLLTTGGSDWHHGEGFGEAAVEGELLETFLRRLGLPAF